MYLHSRYSCSLMVDKYLANINRTNLYFYCLINTYTRTVLQVLLRIYVYSGMLCRGSEVVETIIYSSSFALSFHQKNIFGMSVWTF